MIEKTREPRPWLRSLSQGTPRPFPLAFRGRKSAYQRGPKTQVLKPVLTHKPSKGVILHSSGKTGQKEKRMRHKNSAGLANRITKWLLLSTAQETPWITRAPGFPWIPLAVGCPPATAPANGKYRSRCKPRTRKRIPAGQNLQPGIPPVMMTISLPAPHRYDKSR